MFGKRTAYRLAAAKQLAELQAAYNALDKAHSELIAETERLRNRPYLIDITREARLNKFTFVRGTSVFVVETYSAMADDFTGWKRDLLE